MTCITEELLFPVPIYKFEPDDIDNTALAADILEWKGGTDSKTISNGGDNWHSPTDAFEREPFAPLTRALVDACTRIVQRNPPEGGCHVRMIEMWANCMERGGFHRPHTHGDAAWSGVYFVAAEEDHPPITFMNTVGRDLISHQVKPKAGMAIIFPGWLVHAVDPSLADLSRISVSCNFALMPPKNTAARSPFVCVPELLDKKEMTRIHRVLSGRAWQKGRVGGGKGDGRLAEEVRNNEVQFARPDDRELKWLFEKIAEHAGIVNEGFGLDISGGAQPMQFARYGKGQKYDVHTDASANPEDPTSRRTLTCCITLANPVKGGGTSFPQAPEQPPLQKPGDALFFSAGEPHAALPVKRGQRQTLIVWFERASD